MKAQIYCKPTSRGVHSFFIRIHNRDFFLFSQGYRKGVHNYFRKGVFLDNARNYAKTHHDSAIMRTMDKLPLYIKYIEREYGIIILRETKKRLQAFRPKERLCA